MIEYSVVKVRYYWAVVPSLLADGWGDRQVIVHSSLQAPH